MHRPLLCSFPGMPIVIDTTVITTCRKYKSLFNII